MESETGFPDPTCDPSLHSSLYLSTTELAKDLDPAPPELDKMENQVDASNAIKTIRYFLSVAKGAPKCALNLRTRHFEVVVAGYRGLVLTKASFETMHKLTFCLHVPSIDVCYDSEAKTMTVRVPYATSKDQAARNLVDHTTADYVPRAAKKRKFSDVE